MLFFLSSMVFWNSPWSPPSHTQLVNGYAATPISSTNTGVVADVTIMLSPFELSHFGTNCRLRWSTHPQWNPSRHSWTPTGSPCPPKYPYYPSPPTTHPSAYIDPRNKLTPKWPFPHTPTTPLGRVYFLFLVTRPTKLIWFDLKLT